MINIELLKDYYNKYRYSANDRNSYTFDSPNQNQNEQVKTTLFNLVPSLLPVYDNFKCSFALSATELIDKLLSRYAKHQKDTLCVFIGQPHENIKRIVHYQGNEINYVYIDDTKKLKDLQIDFSVYNKIVIYSTSTEYHTGIVHNSEDIKSFYYSVKNHANALMVNDAVQEMFLSNRDYSWCDYIISTAHSIVISFDMGILISRVELEDFGYQWYKDPIRYFTLMNNILPLAGLDQYYDTCCLAFKDYIDSGKIELYQNHAPQSFCFKFNLKNDSELLKYYSSKDRLILNQDNFFVFKLRIQEVLNNTFPEATLKSLNRVFVRDEML